MFATNSFILHQLQFHATKVTFNAFFKNSYFRLPDYYGKLPIICYFLLVLRNNCTSANNLKFLSKIKSIDNSIIL